MAETTLNSWEISDRGKTRIGTVGLSLKRWTLRSSVYIRRLIRCSPEEVRTATISYMAGAMFGDMRTTSPCSMRGAIESPTTRRAKHSGS